MQNVKHNMLIALFVMIAAGFECPGKDQLDFFLSGGINKDFFVEYTKYKEANKKRNMASFCESKKKEMTEENPQTTYTTYLKTVCKTNEASLNQNGQLVDKNKKENGDTKFKPVITDIEMSIFSIIVRITLKSESYALKIGLDHVNNLDDGSLTEISRKELNSAASKFKKTIQKEVNVIEKLKEENYKSISELFIERCIIYFDNQKSNIVVKKDSGRKLGDFIQLKDRNNKQNYLTPADRKELYKRFLYILKEMEKKKISLCAFNPNNILFDKENYENTKLFDFVAVKFNNEVCDFTSSKYAPPEGDRYYLSSFIVKNERKFLIPSAPEYRRTVINKIININGREEKNIFTELRDVESELEKRKSAYNELNSELSEIKSNFQNMRPYLNAIKSKLENEKFDLQDMNSNFKIIESKLENMENGLKVTKQRAYDSYLQKLNEFTKHSIIVWSEIERNKEYHKFLDQPPVEENTDSKKFDIFSLGVVIIEFELINYKRLCDKADIRVQIGEAYNYDFKGKINYSIEFVDRYMSEDLKNLFSYIGDHVFDYKSKRPELDDFEKKVEKALNSPNERCSVEKNKII